MQPLEARLLLDGGAPLTGPAAEFTVGPYPATDTPMIVSSGAPQEGISATNTWYVRPYGGSYGAENGTSYANAWDGLGRVIWGSSGVKAGDTLYICGTHPSPNHYVGGTAVNGHTYLAIGASGTAGAPITIRGDYAGDPGRVLRVTRQYQFNAASPSADGWTEHQYTGGGYDFTYYTRTSWGGTGGMLEMDVASGDVHWLHRAWDTPSADPSQWTGDGVAYHVFNGTYYFKPRAATTVSLVYTDSVATVFSANNKDYITIKDLVMHGGSSESRGMIQITNDCDYWTMDSLTIKYSAGRGIVVYRDNNQGDSAGLACDHGEIKDCYIGHMGSGIYTVSAAPHCHSDWWIHGNTVEYMFQDNRYLYIDDYHGICLEGGSNHLVEHNVVRHTGSCGLLFDLKEANSDPAKRGVTNNATVRYNWIEDVHRDNEESSNETTFAVSSTVANHLPDNNVNCKAYGNLFIRGWIDGIGGDAMGEPSAGAGDSWLLADNLVIDTGQSAYPYLRHGGFYAYHSSSYPWDLGYHMYNQIFAESHNAHIRIGGNDGFDDKQTVDYTLYDAQGSSKWVTPIGTYGTFSSWKAGTGKDQHSPMPGDPRFVNRAANDFHLQWDSPAIDAGHKW